MDRIADGIALSVGLALFLLIFGLLGFVYFGGRGDEDDAKPRVTSVVAPTSLQPKCIDACSQRFERARLDWRRYCETSGDVRCNSTDGPRDWSVVFRAVDDQTTTCLCRIDSGTSAIW